MRNELVRSEKNGAVIVVADGPYAGNDVEYHPRSRGDRWPWRISGPADNGLRFGNNEVRAESLMIDDRATSAEPYPDPPEFYFGVRVPGYFLADWAREPGHAFRMGVLNTIAMVAEYHDVSTIQDTWRHKAEEDGKSRTAWLRGER